MNTRHHDEILAALIAMPQRDLVDVLNGVFSRRAADLAAPDIEEGRLLLVEAYRPRSNDSAPSPWELLVLASASEKDAYCTDLAPTQEGSCCGVTLAAYAKHVVCPLCGKHVGAT